METVIGRKNEIKKLKKILQSKEAEFLAIYGRRRVGKTFLIREVFQNNDFYFELVGQKDAGFKEQLKNFHTAIHKAFRPRLPVKMPESWKEAFSFLTALLENVPKGKKIIIFLDYNFHL